MNNLSEKLSSGTITVDTLIGLYDAIKVKESFSNGSPETEDMLYNLTEWFENICYEFCYDEDDECRTQFLTRQLESDKNIPSHIRACIAPLFMAPMHGVHGLLTLLEYRRNASIFLHQYTVDTLTDIIKGGLVLPSDDDVTVPAAAFLRHLGVIENGGRCV